jgi:hypothetical protein
MFIINISEVEYSLSSNQNMQNVNGILCSHILPNTVCAD